jgi:uncharacterized membrane protein YgdD (TMEM256/DUF423 family)
MNGGTITALGAGLAGAAVALGAFGAHGLRARVSPEMLAVFETGVRYQFYHALGLILLGVFASRSLPRLDGGGSNAGVGYAAWCFVAGIALFSGSLYGVTLAGARWLGAITPIGGVLFLVGWALFARAAMR